MCSKNIPTFKNVLVCEGKCIGRFFPRDCDAHPPIFNFVNFAKTKRKVWGRNEVRDDLNQNINNLI